MSDTATIPHPERIPPVLATKMAEVLAEALDLAERAQSLAYIWNEVERTIELLAYDDGLGIKTTTYDPDSERLTVLGEYTGQNTVFEVLHNTALMLTGDAYGKAEPLRDLRERLNIPGRGGPMHPPEDCDDCGRLHIPWSEHERAREEAEREADEHGDVATMRLTRLHSITPDGVPLYVEVDAEG